LRSRDVTVASLVVVTERSRDVTEAVRAVTPGPGRTRAPCAAALPRGHMLKGAMRATMSYTILRLLLFFAVLLVLHLLGAGGILLLVLAAAISALISFVLLSRLRDSMSASLSARLGRFRQRLDEGTRSEDID
jgi:hypothetical protein